MYRISERRLAGVINSGNKALLKGSNIGLEKESLRVSPEGNIAQTRHPSALGAALTHPYITTDYSEALVEFITPPFGDLGRSLAFLRDTQKFVYDNLVDEILWATSMPCVVAGETSIPIAQYGTSNAGMMKTVYRRGLGHRYGRVMQVIAGVHFNFSFPETFWPAFQELEGDRRPLKDFISDSYFALIRNLQRVGWLIPYLFGASPAVCKSFLGGRPTSLHEFN
ncbi:MAG TPA: glutamate--cysteine ligase, partial [Gammaproteobacteria bacterium]|nr:glutamate--cysteine ligase [Gammaproteobacteria bacterium]